MKEVFKCIYDFLKNTEVSDFFSCITNVIKSVLKEIYTLTIITIKYPLTKTLELIIPSDIFLNNKTIDFKKSPLESTCKYLKHTFKKIILPLNGKNIEDSADLIDFKYTRWCVFIYLVMAGTYWFYEIGIPNFESPKEDFAQLMSHEALVKLTVVFGATMGIIALLHRSIVSDYQIKQQSKTEKLSNYFKISEHIISHAKEIIIKSNEKIIPSGDFPYGIINNFFPLADTGNYSLSPDLKFILNRYSSLHYVKDYNHLSNTFENNIFNAIDRDEKLQRFLFNLLTPIISGQDKSRRGIYSNLISRNDIDKRTRLISKIICVESTPDLTPTYYDAASGIDILVSRIMLLDNVTRSIKNMLQSIPLGDSSDIDLVNSSLSIISNLLRNIGEFKLLTIKTIDNESILFSKFDELFPKIDGSQAHVDKRNKHTLYFIIFIFCCSKLNHRKVLNCDFDPDYSIEVIDSLESISSPQKENIKSYIREYVR